MVRYFIILVQWILSLIGAVFIVEVRENEVIYN